MSLEMYKKLKLNDLNTSSIPHVVGASGKSLGTRGKTKCEVNINGRIFYQTFIVCEHLKRPIILGRDFSIQNCIGISWTKSNTHPLTQNNEVIAETTEYQDTIQIFSFPEKEYQSTTTILRSSRCQHQHHGEHQSRSHPQPTLVKCTSQHMHISHDSRPEGQGTKYDNTIRYHKLQPSQTFTSPEGSHSGLHRKGLQ